MRNVLLSVYLAVTAWFTHAIRKAVGPDSLAGLFMARMERAYRAYVRWVLKTFGRPMGTMALVSLAPVLVVVGAVLTVIIVVLVLAALAPEFFQAAADITGAITQADLNNTLANTIAGIVAILVPLILLFAFVALIFKAAKIRGGR